MRVGPQRLKTLLVRALREALDYSYANSVGFWSAGW